MLAGQPDFSEQIAQELQLTPVQVDAALQLFTAGGTVPFVARYRKEATGGLDEVQLRTLLERNVYLHELEQRRQSVLSSISEQGKLTDLLKKTILECTSKSVLEDLYLPYKPKRRTKATIAKDRGLEPLAELLWKQCGSDSPEDLAMSFVDAEKGVSTVDDALAGARDILAERIAENADIRALIRQTFVDEGAVHSEVDPEKATQRTKFEQYYKHHESVRTIPSHRYLAIRRGEREGVLRVQIEVDAAVLVSRIEASVGAQNNPVGEHVKLACRDAYKRLLAPSIESDVRVELKMRADREAVELFAHNLRDLLLAPPLGGRSVLAIDPGLRTGCKCVVLDATGSFVGKQTLFLCRGDVAEAEAAKILESLLLEHTPGAIAVGNGTGGRETEVFVRRILKKAQEIKAFDSVVVSVNESGASIYSASDIAREEFPDLDLTFRGAISIGRRLQDPLAELVKIEPKSIGVGQYQHDVYQPLLTRKLDDVVESCVNHVGVELNTASAPLLGRVAGVGANLAQRIVQYRQEKGAFKSRQQLLKVSGMGPRTFEQAAGFLRIHDGEHPLDASAVHPERYALVETMAKDVGCSLQELVGQSTRVCDINLARYVNDQVGEPTLRDIVAELQKPGRDPRQSFEAVRFRDDIHSLEDLRQGMQLEAVVTNVTAFGAFVDIGVHQDGLVHVSHLADEFVKNPRDVVRPGDKLKVWVLDVDLERRRIALSARREMSAQTTAESEDKRQKAPSKPRQTDPRKVPKQRGGKSAMGKTFSNNPFAGVFRR